MGGISISEVNSTNVYFLNKSVESKIENKEIPIGSFGIVGSIQGRYEISANTIKRPKSNDLKDSEMTFDELESKINNKNNIFLFSKRDLTVSFLY